MKPNLTPRICENCGKKYYRKRREKTNKLESLCNFRKRKYCSFKCYWKELESKMKERNNHPNWEKRIKKACLVCGKEIIVLPSRNFRRFCSMSCATKQKHLNGVIKSPGGWNKNKKISKQWRKKLREAKLKNPVRHWLNKARPEMRKEIKSLWREYRRQLRERTEYQNWIRYVFKRDNYTCQKCGKKNGLGITVYLHAHHKKPAKLYPNLILDYDNGQTLCKKCHYKIHSNQGLNK